MMKLSVRPSQKAEKKVKGKQVKPVFTTATKFFMQFLPKVLVGPPVPRRKRLNRYAAHQGTQECARRVRNGQAGTCYHK